MVQLSKFNDVVCPNFTLSFTPEMLLVNAFESERFQFLVDVVFLNLLWVKLELWLHLFQFNWSPKAGPFHGPDHLLWLILHGWLSLKRHGWPWFSAFLGLRGHVLAAANLSITTPTCKRIRATWALIWVVNYDRRVIKSLSNYSILPFLFGFFFLHLIGVWLFSVNHVIVEARLRPLNVLKTHLKNLVIVI